MWGRKEGAEQCGGGRRGLKQCEGGRRGLEKCDGWKEGAGSVKEEGKGLDQCEEGG